MLTREARKHQKVIEVKEIKMRPNIDDHDYDVKMRAVNRFIEEGDKVKITLRFRGRELSHQQLGMNLLRRVQEDVAEVAKIAHAAGAHADRDRAPADVTPLAGGLLMLAMFIPVHLDIWNDYPVWYHVTFLSSLPVLAWIGGRLARTE